MTHNDKQAALFGRMHAIVGGDPISAAAAASEANAGLEEAVANLKILDRQEKRLIAILSVGVRKKAHDDGIKLTNPQIDHLVLASDEFDAFSQSHEEAIINVAGWKAKAHESRTYLAALTSALAFSREEMRHVSNH